MAIDPKEIANTIRAVLLNEDGAHAGTSANPLKSDAIASTDMFGGGVHPVTTVALAATITGVPKSIIIRADAANVGHLYVGKADVTSTGVNALTFLAASDAITIDYNDTVNPYYVVGNTSTSQLFWKGALL